MSTFIVFGNLERPFVRMVQSVLACYELLPTPIFVQAGINLQFFEDRIPGSSLFKTCSFTEFSDYMHNAELVISHGGVGAVKESIFAGLRPAVFVRRFDLKEHIDDHQVDWCNLLFRKDLAAKINDLRDLKTFIESRNFTLKNPEVASRFFDESRIKCAVSNSVRRFLG